MKYLIGAMSVMTVLVGAQSASALTINFCPADSTCPANVTEASLTFTLDTLTLDPNDYTLDLRIVGGAGDPTFIDQVEFVVTGVDGSVSATGYAALPTLTSAPANGAPWSVFFDNVSGNAGSCTSNTGQQNGVCANSTDPGALTNGTNDWIFYVNFGSSVPLLTDGSNVNLRAVFTDADGKNGGILSPNGGDLGGAGGSGGGGAGETPEPATMLLLGTGLVGAALRLRRKKNA